MSANQQRGAVASGAGVALAVCCLANFVPNYAQYQASPLATQLMEMLSISDSQYSLLFSAPMFAGIFLSFVGGLLIDRFGPKRVVGTALAVTAVGCCLRVAAQSYVPMLIGTALTGVAPCFLSAGAGKILAGYYGADRVGSKMGVLMAFSTIGMTVALATTAMLGSVATAFTISAALAVAVLALWAVLLKDPERGAGGRGQGAATEPAVIECLKVALRSANVWKASLALGFITAANVVVASFAPTALAAGGIDSSVSGAVTSLYTLGCLAGCFTAPFLVGRLAGRSKPVLISYALVSAAGVAFSCSLGNAALVAAAMFVTGNCLGGLIPMCYSMPVQFDEVGPAYAGTAGGVLTTMQALGAILLPSYVYVPLAGGSYPALYLLGGASMLAAAVLLLLLDLD